MRKHSPYLCQLGFWRSDQIVHNTQSKLADDINLASQQKIKMFSHGTCQRVLNRNHCPIDTSASDAVENFEGPRTRDNLGARQHGFRRFMAERSELSLNCDLHFAFHCFRDKKSNLYRETCGRSFVITKASSRPE